MTSPSPNVDPRIDDLLRQRDRPLLSYEFFPPKSEGAAEKLRQTIQRLSPTSPDFVTVTYGAGGSTQEKTFEIAGDLRAQNFKPVMPHLTCVGKTREELKDVAEMIYDNGFRNIMTLRGDPPKGQEHFVPADGGLSCARDLVHLLKECHQEFCLGVAGYPEGHLESKGPRAELEYLKSKVDAGASFITTQLFLENDSFYRFRDQCDAAGIRIPILPGLMPAMSTGQIQRIAAMCGASLPPDLLNRLAKAGDNKEAGTEVGILWCTEQILDLLRNEVPGIHLYILNQVQPALSYQLARSFLDQSQPPSALTS
jgi:methylenetetrahydrofolate reductase (NADPH)